jgi:hypothetical protein
MKPLPKRLKIQPESHEQIPIRGADGTEYGFAHVLRGACGPNSILRPTSAGFLIEATREEWEPKTEKDYLHVLRNPFGHTEKNIRAARLWAADQIDPPPQRAEAQRTTLGDAVKAASGGEPPIPFKGYA